MSYLSGRCLALAALALACMPLVHAQAPQVRPPVEHFFDNPPLSGALLSPDARSLAVLVAIPGRRDSLAVIDLATMKITPAAGFPDADIGHFQWVNNKRLAYDVGDRKQAWGDQDMGAGLYAVNSDGSGLRQLVNRDGGEVFSTDTSIRRKILKWNNFLVGQRGSQDSDAVFVYSPDFDGHDAVRKVDLRRLDTVDASVVTVARPPNTHHWLLDHKGEPRLSMASEGGVDIINYLDPATGAWRALTSFDAYTGGQGAFTPLAFGPDGTLYVETNAGADKAAVHTFNLATGKINPEPLIVTKDYDFTGELIFNHEKLLGMRLTTDAKSTVWFDARMKQVQQAVDQQLPATVNLVSVAARAETPWVLVESYSDVSPAATRIFNTDTGKFASIGNGHPKIVAAQMGQQEAVRYKARDGLEIPGLLTLPAGSKGKNLPMVVLVHGGPFLRGASWGWDAEVQFLASRGYAVLQPEFRGSTGFGAKHFRAGWKQWGLAMQNDIADGTRWAIAQGYADPKRICIAGASYGGYATLMGLVNDPELYKCGIDWVGVTDINLLYGSKWRFTDFSERYRKYGMPTLVGDQVKDAAQLSATSPIVQAARITQPLLLAYGGSDLRVPLVHGERFHAAVKGHNPNVEWVVYPAEGHGWSLPATRYDFWTRVEKFLDKQIGQP